MKVSNEKPQKGDLILIEIGIHSGKYIIGKVHSYHEQETGDIIYYCMQMWHYHDKDYFYAITTDCIAASQCKKLIMNDK